jgi:hypothetical protein
MAETMKAAVFEGPERIVIDERRFPACGPTDAIVKVTLTTICGTDVHIWREEYPVEQGRIVGHEPVGEIHQLGEAVQGYEVGERVLERAGIPLHVKELGRRIKGGGWRHPRGEPSRPDQLLYQLAARLPRHADKFRRVAPNTYGLVKCGEKGTAKPPSRPRVGLFASEGAITGRQAGQQQDEVAQGDEWRSS